MYFEGNVTYSANSARFNLIASHNYNLSSRKMFDHTNVVPAFYNIYWHLTHEVEKTNLPVSQKSFSVSKSNQAGRSLIVFASEADYPGHFKVFGNGASSESIDLIGLAPQSPQGLSVR
jgi:hypothetical protein